MKNNELIKYRSGELERVSNSIEITKKLLSIDRRNLFDFFSFFPITTLYCDLSEEQKYYYTILNNLIKENIVDQLKHKGIRNIKEEIERSINKLRIASYGTPLTESSQVPTKLVPKKKSDAKYEKAHELLAELYDLIYPTIIKQVVREEDTLKAINISVKSNLLIKELLVLRDAKVLIVSPFIKILDHLGPLLSENGLRYRQLDGDTINRLDVLKEFNSPSSNCNILIASQKAFHGINVNAEHIFILNPTGLTSELTYIITRNRIFREKVGFKVYAIVCRNTIEEKLISLQKRIKGDQKYLDNVSAEDIIELFS